MSKEDKNNIKLMESFIFAISYDENKHDAALWINSKQILHGRMNELSNEMAGKFIKEITMLSHLYLVCKGDKELQNKLLDNVVH